MPPRRNPPVTAESLLDDLIFQMESFLSFLEADLSPAIADTSTTGVGYISRGANSRLWIPRLRTLLGWSSLALEEEEWLRRQGLDHLGPRRHIRGVWSIPSFLRHHGRSDDHNACSALQLGRKIRRFEVNFGEGIAILLAPVLPAFRRLTLVEEVKAMQLLRAHETDILLNSTRLLLLKSKYQTLVPHPILPIP